MAKRPLIKPSKRILVLNKKFNEFISKEDDDEMRKLEEEKQRLAKEKALNTNTMKVPGL